MVVLAWGEGWRVSKKGGVVVEPMGIPEVFVEAEEGGEGDSEGDSEAESEEETDIESE